MFRLCVVLCFVAGAYCLSIADLHDTFKRNFPTASGNCQFCSVNYRLSYYLNRNPLVGSLPLCQCKRKCYQNALKVTLELDGHTGSASLGMCTPLAVPQRMCQGKENAKALIVSTSVDKANFGPGQIPAIPEFTIKARCACASKDPYVLRGLKAKEGPQRTITKGSAIFGCGGAEGLKSCKSGNVCIVTKLIAGKGGSYPGDNLVGIKIKQKCGCPDQETCSIGKEFTALSRSQPRKALRMQHKCVPVSSTRCMFPGCARDRMQSFN